MIKQTVTFDVPPKIVYDALMDETKHSAFTEAGAKIDPTVGGAFAVWNGYATGKNLELTKGKKIVQTWHASDWPDEAFSTVTFLFKPIPSGTELTFTQENVPKEFEAEIDQGWKDNYWTPMKEYFEKS